MSSLKTQFITHNPFSTLLEIHYTGFRREVGLAGVGGGWGAWRGCPCVQECPLLPQRDKLAPLAPASKPFTLIPFCHPWEDRNLVGRECGRREGGGVGATGHQMEARTGKRRFSQPGDSTVMTNSWGKDDCEFLNHQARVEERKSMVRVCARLRNGCCRGAKLPQFLITWSQNDPLGTWVETERLLNWWILSLKCSCFILL